MFINVNYRQIVIKAGIFTDRDVHSSANHGYSYDVRRQAVRIGPHKFVIVFLELIRLLNGLEPFTGTSNNIKTELADIQIQGIIKHVAVHVKILYSRMNENNSFICLIL